MKAMTWVQPMPHWQVTIYHKLLSIRPAQAGAMLKRILLIRRRLVTLQSGQRFLVDPVSVFGLSLISDGVYEPQLTKLVEQILRLGDVFVDVGGNEGYFSVVAAACVGNGQVYSIEPQSRLLPIIAANGQLNAANTIVVEQTALTDRVGTVELFLRPSTNTGASSMFRHWRLGSTTEQVIQTTLDELLNRHAVGRVRLLKCDCEGAEYLVVRGGVETLREQRIDFIAMEYHISICGIARCKEADSALRSAGYMLTRVGGQYLYHLPGLEHEIAGLGELSHSAEW
jgi:FkbM family methyltransferase